MVKLIGMTRCATSMDRGLGMYGIDGLLAPENRASVLKHNHDWLLDSCPAAQIADYSRSIVMVDPDDLLASAVDIGQGDGGLRTPTALLVQRWQLEMMRDYAALMRRAGFSRAAFSCPEKARAWAAEQAALWAAQLEHQQRANRFR